MNKLREHLKKLGPAWAHFTVVPLMGYGAYIVLGRGELRWEMIALCFVPTALAFYSVRTRRLYDGMYPIWATAILYDSMRFMRDLGVSADRVHICDLRQHELDLFGITSGGVKITLQDYFLAHSHPWADLYLAIPYGTFIYVSVAFAMFLYFKDQIAFRRYAWTFFSMNVLAYITYHVYPAAPPWYYHAHGCTLDLGVHASAGTHLAAVDRMIGYDYFSSFYGRSADVFGAVPSLHCAYPLLIVLEGWRLLRGFGRAASLIFLASMMSAAVYLDHHWVIDVILGLAYAAGLNWLMRAVLAKDTQAAAAAPVPAFAAGEAMSE